MATNQERDSRIEQLEAQIAKLLGRVTPRGKPLRNEDRADYVAQGSPQHATVLGLIKAKEDETLVSDGWTMGDSTLYGPNATEKFIQRILDQKVNELNTPVPLPQSKDPLAPNFAPVLWQPGMSLNQLTE